jgi:prepilin-type N-terminal cleavage/methylation domain-containing protein
MQKGFTLIELLIVIAILAVLSVAVVVVLNPAELLKQARDSTRISDLASVNSAVALYLTDVTGAGLGGANDASCATAGYRVSLGGQASPFGISAILAGGGAASTSVDGTGWVAVDFMNTTGGSPLGRLPLDPTNNATYYYAYACGSTTQPLWYELDAKLESTKYAGYLTTDGGSTGSWYEVGNNLFQ